MDYLREHATGRVYQIALSEAIYYGPNPVWGDALGPVALRRLHRSSAGRDGAQAAPKLGFEAIAMPQPWCRSCATRDPASTIISP